MTTATPTAAVLVIGSEVLSGKVRDENGYFAACRLRELGVKLSAILTIPDRSDDIVEAVVRERARVTWLFTSGGVGPTHDDVTLPAVARTLGRPLIRLAALESALRAGHQRSTGSAELPEAALRMADVPEGTRLMGHACYPILVVENVVMLPGVPQFFKAQFDRFSVALAAPPFRLASLYLGVGEERIATTLDQIAAAFPDVEIGSYPRFDEADHRVRVTVEAKDLSRVEMVLKQLLDRLPEGSVLRTEGP